jgi:hypothetical protein
VTRRRWYVVGGAISGTVLAIALITGTTPWKGEMVCYAADPIGFKLCMISWVIVFAASAYGVLKAPSRYALAGSEDEDEARWNGRLRKVAGANVLGKRE